MHAVGHGTATTVYCYHSVWQYLSDGTVQVTVTEDDQRRLATELKGDLLDIALCSTGKKIGQKKEERKQTISIGCDQRVNLLSMKK